jgi:hypothetical protein
MSQAGRNINTSGPGAFVQTLTGNSGGPVGPTGGNINVVGDGTIVSVAGNAGTSTLTISVAGTVPTVFHTDSGDATPAANAITMHGGSNISTSGAGSTVTYNVSGTTNNAVQVGNAGGSLTSLTVGTNGQVFLGATAANPAFITPTAGNGLSVTANATTLAWALTAPVSIANGGTNSTSMAVVDGTVIFDGTRLVTTATGTANFVLTSNGAGVAPTYQAVSASGAVTSVSGGNNITITGTATAPIVNVSGTTNHSLLLGNATGSINSLGVATNGQLPIGSTGADPVLAAITAGTGISVTNGAGSITIAATGSGFTWTIVTAASQALVAENGYIANNAGQVTFTLPVAAAVGDSFRVTGKNNATGWKIAQNAGQTIYFSTAATTTGAGGSLTSSATRDTVEIICVTTNNDFQVLSSIGNITVV